MAKITNREIERLYEDGQDAFWASVAKGAKRFGIKYGDFPYDAQQKFDAACEEAVKIWLEHNNLDESTDKDIDMKFAVKSFEQFLAESGGETGWKVEVHKTDLKKAREVAAEVLAKHGKTLDETIPDFDKNYAALRSAVSKSWGVARRDMPVINDNQIDAFRKTLKDGALDILKPFAKGHMLTAKEVMALDNPAEFVHLGFKDGSDKDDKLDAKLTATTVKDLKPIQEQIFLDKVVDMIGQWGPAKQGSPVTKLVLITSGDDYIIDGHHRFACALLSNPSLKMSVLKVPLKIDELLKVTLAYGDAIGNKRNG